MIGLLTQFGDSTSGIGALGVDGKTFIIQLITFIIVILILRKWAVKPILKVLQERRETIEKGVKLGEEMQKEKAKLEADVATALRDARVQADKILSDAQESARQAIAEAEETARTKAAGILTAADAQIKQDAARAKAKLEGELTELISEATEAIIDVKVDAKKDTEFIDKIMKERLHA